MDVGATLRRARENRRLTLDQLSRATKITASNLRALESNDFGSLPAAVYTRGFLRAYAREVGLDPEETVEQYLRQLDDARALGHAEPAVPPTEPTPKRASRQRAADGQHHDEAIGAMPHRVHIDLTSVPRPAIAAAGVVLLVAVIAALAWRGGDADQEVATAEAARQDAADASAPAPAAGDAARAAHVVEDVLRIELKTTGLCWVSASADRVPVLSELLQAGAHHTIQAKDEFVLRVGDPSTITVTINGEPLRPLGRAGMPVTVQITRDNYRDRLAS